MLKKILHLLLKFHHLLTCSSLFIYHKDNKPNQLRLEIQLLEREIKPVWTVLMRVSVSSTANTFLSKKIFMRKAQET